jgi:hypothetical protein
VAGLVIAWFELQPVASRAGRPIIAKRGHLPTWKEPRDT